MDIKELRHELTKLRDKVRFGNLRGADTYKYVLEYHEIIEQIKKLGGWAETKCKYLLPSSYINTGDKWVYIDNMDKPSKVVPQKTNNIYNKESLVPTQTPIKTYTLSIAWVSQDEEEKPLVINRIGEYFNTIGVKYIKENINNYGGKWEHILRYSFDGDNQSFKMLKRCTQFLLDELSTTNEFNIEIFGK